MSASVRTSWSVAVFALCWNCTAQPSDGCGIYSQNIPVYRVVPFDDIGVGIPTARVWRIDKDVGQPDGVPIDRMDLLDPGGRKGRSAMTLVVSAPGFLPDTVRVQEACTMSPDPLYVVLRRAP